MEHLTRTERRVSSVMAPAVPLACRLPGPLEFEASCWEWDLGGFEEEPDWQLQAVRVSQEDKNPNWSPGFKKGARGKGNQLQERGAEGGLTLGTRRSGD